MSDTSANGGTTVTTGDGILVGVQAGKTPDQIRAEQQSRATNFGTDVAGNQPQFQQVPEGQQQGQPPQRLFTAEEVERFRQQEKEKLYPQLQKLPEIEAELNTIKAEREEARKQAEDAEAARKEAERLAAEENMSAKQLIESRTAELQEEIRRERTERERAEAILQQERNLGVLNEYRNGRVREVENDILPELINYVSGNTPEEIDASIEAARQHTASILHGVAQFQQQQRTTMRGVSPSGLPPLGPMETQQETRELSPQDIAAMSPAEYARHRGQLLQASSRQFYGQR